MKKITKQFCILLITLFSTFTYSQIQANDDNLGGPSYMGPLIGNVLNNDTLDGSLISNTLDVIITCSNPAFNINSSGDVLYSGGHNAGSWIIPYTICRASNPSECSTAYIHFQLTATMFAFDDSFTAISDISSYVGNVLLNDYVDSNIATSTTANVDGISVPIGFTIGSDGTITMDGTVTAGTYVITYSANTFGNFMTNDPPSYDTAIATITISPSLVLAVVDTYNDYNADGFVNVGDVINYQFTVSNLSAGSASNILVSGSSISVSGVAIPVLNSGVTDSTTFLGTYVLTLADIMAGTVTNTAALSGLNASSVPVSFLASSTTSLGITDAIKMNVFLDLNGNNSQDVGEQNFSNGEFHYQFNHNGIIHNITNPSGMYTIYETNPTNTYDLTYTIDPAFASVYFPVTVNYPNVQVVTGSGVTTYNFPITEVPFDDLAISILPSRGPVPGFSYYNTIRYENKGTTAIPSGTVTFNHDSNVTINSVASSTPITNGFTFTFTNLLRHEVRYLTVVVNTPTIPTVSLGDLVTNSASITVPSGDIHPSNNNASLVQVIGGAYDPNDKLERHGEKIVFSNFASSDYLTYTIRFENTGTGNAINIKVDDVLDSKLNPTTVRMLDASAPYTLERTGNTLSWKFNGINLPPSVTSSTTTGKGYITFEVKPNVGFAVGDIIPNKANIYFDFNPAIITNNFQTEFIATPSTNSSCWQTFALGAVHTLGIKSDGTLWAWGSNLNGELGDGTNTAKNSPTQIGTDTNWQYISSNGNTNHAIKTDGTLWGWGRNDAGQIGDGTTTDKNFLVQVGFDTNWKKVSTGILHTLAIKTDGTLWAWGNNLFGQLGDNTSVNKIIPVKIGTDTNWESCDASKRSFSAARKTNGLLYLWGEGVNGQQGNGSFSNVLAPTMLSGANYTSSYALGYDYVVALRAFSGIIDSWGLNIYGNLGNGTNTDTSIPAPINSDTDWTFVETAYYTTIAKKSNGTIWTWGYNSLGTLGNGNNIDTNTPTQINSDTDWDKIYVGNAHVIASKNDGTFWTWGYNGSGQFGNGTNTSSNIPIQLSCVTLSSDTINNVQNLIVYPNPANRFLNINSKSIIQSTEITDLNGRTILKSKENSNEVTLNIVDLSSGIYLLRVTTESGSSTQKIIKQ